MFFEFGDSIASIGYVSLISLIFISISVCGVRDSLRRRGDECSDFFCLSRRSCAVVVVVVVV